MAEALAMSNDPLANALRLFDEDRFGYGDLLSHDWLDWALDVPTPRTVGESKAAHLIRLNRVQEFRDRLLTQRQMATESVAGSGYRIVPPAEQAGFAAVQTSEGIAKALRRGRGILRCTNIAALDDTARRQHADVTAKMDTLARMNRKGRRDLLSEVVPPRRAK